MSGFHTSKKPGGDKAATCKRLVYSVVMANLIIITVVVVCEFYMDMLLLDNGGFVSLTLKSHHFAFITLELIVVY
eukprot:snap_masked-scaffold_12-processed-gene-10.47-mRNA-1 protein AED:1.00 eAED:1.00 QI:0/0/0/0/1/1/2/0/74